MTAVTFPRTRPNKTGVIDRYIVEAEEDRRLALLCVEYGVEAGKDSSYRDLALAMARVHHSEPQKKGRKTTWRPSQLLVLCWDVHALTKTGMKITQACQLLAKDPYWQGYAQTLSGTYSNDTAEVLRVRYYKGKKRGDMSDRLRDVAYIKRNFVGPEEWPNFWNRVKRKLLPNQHKR